MKIKELNQIVSILSQSGVADEKILQVIYDTLVKAKVKPNNRLYIKDGKVKIVSLA